MTLGSALQRKGQLDDAMAEYREAIRLRTDDAVTHNNLGTILFARARLAEAIAEFREAVRLKQDFFEAYCNLGGALGGSGQFDDAIVTLRTAIRLKSDYAMSHYNLGGVLYRKGRAGEAVAELRETIRLQNDYGQAHHRLAWLLATAADPALRDPAAALRSAEKAVALASTAANWTVLGLAQYRVGDYKAAVAALERSMTLHSGGDASEWFFLAMSHAMLGDKDTARAWYDRAARWMDTNQSMDEEYRRIRAEAAQVLKVDTKND